MNDTVKIIIVIILGFVVLRSCNTCSNNKSSNTTSQTWQKSPVDKLITKYKNENNFAIILEDMDSRSNKYFHMYNVVIEKPDTVLAYVTGWEEVSDIYFSQNVDNMGMEIASKKDGKLSKTASPAGYNHYVGNEKYGRWEENNGSSFWSFYGRYAFMSSMFNMMAYPARRSYWNDYNRGGYYGNRSYHGPAGQNYYGTKNYTSTSGKKTTWGSKSSSFKQNVRSEVSRSAKASKSGFSKTSRSSNRYSSSSSRSRSGGFGK